MRSALLLFSVLWLAGCSSQPAPAPAPAPARKASLPPNDTHRFPSQNQTEAKVVGEHLLGHSFLPGGNIATYKQGGKSYDLILIRASSPTDAAILLLDYKKQLGNPKLVAHFGGYFGQDGPRPAFVFTKGNWLCGVLGLPEAEADAVARSFAARLN